MDAPAARMPARMSISIRVAPLDLAGSLFFFIFLFIRSEYAHRESNPDPRFRKPMSCPLDDRRVILICYTFKGVCQAKKELLSHFLFSLLLMDGMS